MASIHADVTQSEADIPDRSSTPANKGVQPKITTVLKTSASMEFRISRMAAKDNISFNTMVTSVDIRQFFTVKFPNKPYPKSCTTVKDIVLSFAKVVFF
jgi:hypothetical protein